MLLTRKPNRQEPITKPKPSAQSTKPIRITSQDQLTEIKDRLTDYDIPVVYRKYRSVSRHLPKHTLWPDYDRLLPYVKDQYIENLTVESVNLSARRSLKYLNFPRGFFENCVFVNCSLTAVNLKNATFVDCVFVNCMFTDCNLSAVDFVGCRMENTVCCGCNMTYVTAYRTEIWSGGFMFSNLLKGTIQESTLTSTVLKNCGCYGFTFDSNKVNDSVMSDCATDNIVRFYTTESPTIDNLQSLKLRASYTPAGNVIGYLPATSPDGPAIIKIKILCPIEAIGSDKNEMCFVREDQFDIMSIMSLSGYPLQSADTIIERVHSVRNDGRYIHFFLSEAECMKFV